MPSCCNPTNPMQQPKIIQKKMCRGLRRPGSAPACRGRGPALAPRPGALLLAAAAAAASLAWAFLAAFSAWLASGRFSGLKVRGLRPPRGMVRRWAAPRRSTAPALHLLSRWPRCSACTVCCCP